MRHVSLYRKWRPRTFDAVAGQEPVVRTLKRAIETGRVAHAYLFSGPRGTGKTSTAKVLAMGLNCESGPTVEPDGTCESCRAIVNNSSMDVLEMDAASNRGIDEIRDLRDRVNLAPVGGRMKVYIIDEVHMLTTEAFNALLKMLEEPPEHVVFVLATTEKHKVLPTIISRCQSFDFRRPGVALLAGKLREIADAEGIEAEDAALTLISREAHGSFRDAEGLLDQLGSFSDGSVTAVKVRELLGGVGSEVLLETADALYERRAADALRVVDRLQNEGRDISRFVGELISHLRRLMLLPHAPEVALAEVGNEERAGLEEQAGRIPTTEVVRVIEALGESLARARRGNDPKLEIELTFLKLARDYEEPQVDALLRRLEIIEMSVANGVLAASRPDGAHPAASATLAAPPAADDGGDGEPAVSATVEDEELAGEGEEDSGDAKLALSLERDGAAEEESEASGGVEEPVDVPAELRWGAILSDLVEQKQRSTETIFKEARVESFDGETLELVFPEEQSYLLGLARDSRYLEPLQKVLRERLGKRPQLEVRAAGEHGPGPAAWASAGAPGGDAGVAPVREGPEARFRSREDAAPPPAADDIPEPPTPGSSAPGAPTRVEPEAVHPQTPKLEMRAGAEREAPEAGNGLADEEIRDSREVVAMAREFFGPGGERNGGS